MERQIGRKQETDEKETGREEDVSKSDRQTCRESNKTERQRKVNRSNFIPYPNLTY